ncbi:ABC transporter ATP-binding protein [Clostridium tetani]|uniref:ABC transporter ATP-binding protein n=1 Tax=Clostridium tetani TaxID=1513 RepID=A0A4Q0VCW9_CLOTA|nr:ABC transporter ATP-binding protein [Clostridium tetani]RXI48502.1 ABC transporter ATP-binding protein [Clostridium tetani]
MEILKLNNISKIYGMNNNKLNALKDINLTINEGELIAIIGASGSGKSTLLNIMGTLDNSTSGEYMVDGKDINNLNSADLARLRNKYFGFIVQNFALINDYTVYENIEIPLEYGKVKSKDRKKIISETLDILSMKDKMNKTPKQLSGGQCQKVAIARALVNDPRIILADEPTGALDRKTGQDIMEILKKLNRQKGKTIIMVTHNLELATRCDRIIKLQDGKIVEDNCR